MVELLVSMAIIGVLVALLLPAVQASREAARRAQCASHLRQMGIALAGYHDAFAEFPIGCEDNRGRQIAWSARLLPYLEEHAAWHAFNPASAYDSRENRLAASRVIATYLCPSTATAPHRHGPTSGDVNANGAWDAGDDLAWIDYGGMFGVGDPRLPLGNGVMIYEQAVSARQILDGLSQTILVGEDSGRGPTMNGHWANGQNIFDQTGPVNLAQNNELFSDHPGGAHAMLCDGSVHLLSETMDLRVLFALCTRAMSD